MSYQTCYINFIFAIRLFLYLDSFVLRLRNGPKFLSFFFFFFCHWGIALRQMFGVRFWVIAFSVTFIHNSFFLKMFSTFRGSLQKSTSCLNADIFLTSFDDITILIVSLTTIEFIFPLYLLWAKLHNSLIIFSANRMAGSWFLSFFWCLPCLLSISVQQIESAVDKTFCQTFEPISLIISFFVLYSFRWWLRGKQFFSALGLFL